MNTFIFWLILLAIAWTFAFYRSSPWVWAASFLIFLSISSYFYFPDTLSLIIAWGLFVLLGALVLLAPLRRALIMPRLFKWFRAMQPPLSEAEEIVLKSGGLWWEKEFYSGKPDWEKLWALEKPELSEQEQAFIDNEVEQLCALLDDWDIVAKRKDLSNEAWEFIKKNRFWGLVIDKAYGGHGFSALGHSAVVTKVASRSVSAAFTIMVPNSLGPAEFITHFGTVAQQQYYLPRLACGEEIACFALTAPQAGSDATSIPDTGVVCHGEFDGEQVVGIKLNFSKRYITLGPVATLIGLAFKLYDPQSLIGDKEDVGITLALIHSNRPGVIQGKRHYPLNLAFMNGPIAGKDVFIPLDWIIGGQARCGQGWQMMMELLAIGRGISLPGLATAAAQLCVRTTGAYAVVREQFNRSIGRFEGIAKVLGSMGGYTYLCNSMQLFTAQAVAQDVRPSIASAITKYHLTEFSRKIVASAMDVHAGRGIQLGPRNYLGNLYNAIPTSITVEGANILTRNLIIFGQGVVRCHPYLSQEMASLSIKDDKEALCEFDKTMMHHVGFLTSQIARLLVYGITGGIFIGVNKKGPMKKYYQQLTRMSNAFCVMTDLSLALLGNKIKIREALSARLGDLVSYFCLASSALKYYRDNGELKAERPLIDWAVNYCLYEIDRALRHYLFNFPRKRIAKLLWYLIFPWGRAYLAPTDVMEAKIARILQRPSKLRDRLSRYCYIGKEDSDPVWKMERAMQAWLKARPLFARVDALIKKGELSRRSDPLLAAKAAWQAKQLTEDEYKQLQHALTLNWDAIQVDEFDQL